MTDQTAVYVAVNGSAEVRLFEIGESYELLRSAVEGMIQCVHLGSIGVDMWLNEEGKIYDLPENLFATYLFAREFGFLDSVRGNVIFTSFDHDTGETIGLTQEQFDALEIALAQLMAEV